MLQTSPRTLVTFLLDRTGSMEAIRDDTIGGFNAFIEGQRTVSGKARVTLALFDHDYDLVFDNIALTEVPLLTQETYVPRGSTALLDAIGRTLDTACRRIEQAPASERPGQVIVAILTDGAENASQHCDLSGVSQQIEQLLAMVEAVTAATTAGLALGGAAALAGQGERERERAESAVAGPSHRSPIHAGGPRDGP